MVCHEDLIIKIKKCIENNHLFPDDCRIVLALSGGADSTGMFLALKEIYGPDRLVGAHFNHKIRGNEAIRDRDFTERLCNDSGVAFKEGSADIPYLSKTEHTGTEETARKYRYEFLNRLSAEYGNAPVAVAHNRNDNAETVFMHIARGSGLNGLTGLSYRKDNIVRPVLDLSHEELISICEYYNIEFQTDSTNMINDCDRNIVRNCIIPYIDSKLGSDFTSSLLKLSDLCEKDNNFLERYTDEVFDRISRIETENGLIRIAVDSSSFSELEFCISSRIVRKCVSKIKNTDGVCPYPDCKDLEYDTVLRADDFIRKSVHGNICEIGRNVIILNTYGRSIFRYSGSDTIHRENCGESFAIRTVEHRNILPGTKLTRTRGAEIFDSDELNAFLSETGSRLVWRTIREGDSFVPFGFKGHVRLRKYFIDSKIPSEKRGSVRFLAAGSNVLWIPGMRRSDIAKITENTKNIIEILPEE